MIRLILFVAAMTATLITVYRSDRRIARLHRSDEFRRLLAPHDSDEFRRLEAPNDPDAP